MIIVKKNSVEDKISDEDTDESMHSNRHFYGKHCAIAFAAILLYAIFIAHGKIGTLRWRGGKQ